jgi:hypothetical protein
MARTRDRVRVVEGPPRYDRYFWMLALIGASMLVGIVVMLMELGGYDSSEAKGGPTITLPKAEDRSPRPPAPAPTPPAGDAAATAPGGT